MINPSTKVYTGLMLLLIILQFVLSKFSVKFPPALQYSLLSWLIIGAAGILGYLGLILSRKCGFPEILDERITTMQRFIIPFFLGLFSGIILLVIDSIHPLGIPHVQFPFSIALYMYGGMLSEIFFRLFPIPFFVWLISYVLLKQRWQNKIFWVVAIVISLLEPISQLSAVDIASTTLRALLFVLIYSVNLTLAFLFKKFGFLAPLIMRLSLYLAWHILRWR